MDVYGGDRFYVDYLAVQFGAWWFDVVIDGFLVMPGPDPLPNPNAYEAAGSLQFPRTTRGSNKESKRGSPALFLPASIAAS